MPACGLIGGRTDHHQLPTGGGKSRIQSRAHRLQWQKSHQDEVNLWNENFFPEGTQYLMRDSAGEVDMWVACHEFGERIEGPGFELDISVQKDEKVAAGGGGKLPAGEIFAAPAGWKILARDHPQVGDGGNKGEDDLSGAIS